LRPETYWCIDIDTTDQSIWTVSGVRDLDLRATHNQADPARDE
jgi:hypothetical protein